MLSLKGKIAAITGAGSGIGEAIALLFAEQGAVVHLIDLDLPAVQGVADRIRKAGGHAEVHGADVGHWQQVETAFDRMEALDILVNNAGIAHIGKADTTSEADFDRVCQVNVKGVFHCLRAAIPLMRERGSGVILNMASIAAHVGLPDRFLYSLTKAAVWNMTLTVAKDYIREKIRCNSISPARVHTPFVDGYLKRTYPGREAEMYDRLAQSQPIGRMATPREVAQLALYLCSDEAAFITGCDYPIDGGFLRLNTG